VNHYQLSLSTAPQDSPICPRILNLYGAAKNWSGQTLEPPNGANRLQLLPGRYECNQARLHDQSAGVSGSSDNRHTVI
jgi:hypothetical protein